MKSMNFTVCKFYLGKSYLNVHIIIQLLDTVLRISNLVDMCLVTQSCPTLFNPMDCSPPGSSVHEILQERILEWFAILFSRGSS